MDNRKFFSRPLPLEGRLKEEVCSPKLLAGGIWNTDMAKIVCFWGLFKKMKFGLWSTIRKLEGESFFARSIEQNKIPFKT